jgi:hypothetical protein
MSRHIGSRVSLSAVAAVLMAAVGSASALTITSNYIAAGQEFPEYGGYAGPAPVNSGGAGDLIDVFNAAADWWELAILDDWSLDIEYGWSPLSGSTLAVTTQYVHPQPPTIGKITFDDDGSSDWYLDPLPYDSAEYTTYTEYSDDLGGGEVNTGRTYTAPTGEAVGLVDLFSTALHEIGHLLGFSGSWPGNKIRIQSPLPYAGTVVPTTGSHINIETALMCPYTTTNIRHFGSEVDILAAAQAAGWTTIDLDAAFPVLDGDLSGDGFVGQADLDIILSLWGQTVLAGSVGDPSGDGFVGQADLDTVLSWWGYGTSPMVGQGQDVYVPEPSMVAIVLAGAAAACLRRRRRGGAFT